ncbi:hypothetical protein IL306_014705 [Fusarium sp. DS 682]|nr:hypothetical protein IL306_014705 [Fusarium sp. DS 682]
MISSKSNPAPPVLDIKEHFLVIHDLSSGSFKTYGGTLDDMNALSAEETTNKPALIFLRGHASPSWFNTIIKVFDASSELYGRHTDYQSPYWSPSLPSAPNRVFELLIPTLCFKSDDVSSEPENLQSRREEAWEKMEKYFRDPHSSARVGDSVIRNQVLLSKQAYALEQRATVEIVRQTDSWRAVVWLDNGGDLSDSPPTVERDRGPNPSIDSNKSWRASKHACVLPFKYGQKLNKDVAANDALYALSELFHFAANAEMQFLNLIQSQIKHELSFIEDPKFHTISLINLSYIKAQLSSHERHLTDTVHILENRQRLDWPSSTSEEAENTAAMLTTNYRLVLQRAKNLGSDTEQGIAMLANASALDLSRMSADNARMILRLSILVTLFIPLSFLSAAWGKTVKEMGTETLPMWWLVVPSVPVVVSSLVIFLLEKIQNYFKI